MKPVDQLTPAEWDATIHTNLSGVFYCCREAIPIMRTARGRLHLQYFESCRRESFPGGSAYNASKFGLNGFSEAMMQDVRYDGIRVSYIMPGSVDTDFGGAPGSGPTKAGSLPERTSPRRWLTFTRIPSTTSPAASRCGPRSLRERSECWPTP